MTKEEAKKLFGKGIVEVNGVKCSFEFSSSLGYDDFIRIYVPTITPFSTSPELGNIWFHQTNDADWEEFEAELPKVIEKMTKQEKIALSQPICLTRVENNENDNIIFVDETKKKGISFYNLKIILNFTLCIVMKQIIH